MERLACLAIGYVFGLFETSYFYGRMHGIDIRNYGSGNAGTTNMFRTMGKGAGVITFLGDALKPIFAAVCTWLIFGKACADIWPLLCLYTGAGAVLGHNFPFYLGFRGGKGIATTGGTIMALNRPMCAIAIVTFALGFFLTGYVSVGSLLVCTGFLIETVIFGQMGIFGMTQRYLNEMYVIAAAITFLAFYRHRGNIDRLRKGEERKAGILDKNKKKK
ncbi:MAG: glycerol-3-phosphate acyltransferase [Lachnospiraceae bacterium]|nr:glycerol-3-phosphate acyltransferase [Lachnospiraceae bacterium]